MKETSTAWAPAGPFTREQLLSLIETLKPPPEPAHPLNGAVSLYANPFDDAAVGGAERIAAEFNEKLPIFPAITVVKSSFVPTGEIWGFGANISDGPVAFIKLGKE